MAESQSKCEKAGASAYLFWEAYLIRDLVPRSVVARFVVLSAKLVNFRTAVRKPSAFEWA
jgi:hypothetical protein